MGSPGTGEEDETSLAGLAGGLCHLSGCEHVTAGWFAVVCRQDPPEFGQSFWVGQSQPHLIASIIT